MVQLIAFIIFILSLGLLMLVLYRKMPALVQLPHNGHHGLKKPKFLTKIEKRIKDVHFKFFKKQMFLHKFLSKVKVLILKIENQIDNLLYGIRDKAKKLEKPTRRRKSSQTTPS